MDAPTAKKTSTRAVALRNYFSPFGNKLIAAGHADADQFRKALMRVKTQGESLPKAIEAITGKALTPELAREYKKNYLFELKVLYGVDSVDPEIRPIANQEMAELIQELRFSIENCRRYKILPLAKQPGDPPSVLVAMVDPDDLAAQDELQRILKFNGLDLRRLVITQEDFDQLIEQYYTIRGELEQAYEKQKKAKEKERDLEQLSDMTDILGSIEGGLADAPEDDSEAQLDSNDANKAPVISLVNKILAKAIQEGTSDIHIEPQETALRVRFLRDGILHQAFDPLPRKLTNAVVARFKIMADMDIAERRAPQDGKIRRIYQGRTVDFRVNTIPSRYGEKVCLRILDNSSTQLGLDFLITNQDTLNTVRELAGRPYGLFLVTGPTGSGKSTSLYSVLAERNNPGVNINTAEDPIEYALPGITQVQVIREKGMDFSSILRAFMRQDPDVILVGETRDKETAKTAIEAALTGHLVLYFKRS